MEVRYRIRINVLLPSNPVVCEVGVAEGNFSQWMAKEWNVSKIYCVDNWGTLDGTGDGNFPQEWHNMNYHTAIWKMYNYRDKTKFLRGPSHLMAQHVPDNSLNLVYLDANHSYEGVKKDLEAWYPKVKPGGVIAGHDYINPAYGVFQAAQEFRLKHGMDIFTIREDKDEDAGFYMIKPK